MYTPTLDKTGLSYSQKRQSLERDEFINRPMLKTTHFKVQLVEPRQQKNNKGLTFVIG